MDGELAKALVRSRRFFTRAEISKDLRTLHKGGGRKADEFYRDRWSHDKVVRTMHGVNCTGSCMSVTASWDRCCSSSGSSRGTARPPGRWTGREVVSRKGRRRTAGCCR